MTRLYPLRFVPVYKHAIWGGQRFETVLGRKPYCKPPYSESWEIADHPHGWSVVENGSLARTSLRELTANRTQELLGPGRSGPQFPLLLKYLDAQKPLSVQVHPDDDWAEQMSLDDTGKDEAWVVVKADPGSLIWAGFNQSVDRQSMHAAVLDGSIERLLHCFEPSAGDCLFLPAGTVHALGEGILVAEIQQASDATFRIFDWGRLGPKGTPRTLHVKQALKAINYGQGRVNPVNPVLPDEIKRPWVERLVESDHFILDRLNLDSPQLVGDGGTCHVITVLGGSVRVAGDGGAGPLKFGQTILLPACLGPVEVKPAGDETAVLIDAYLP